MNNMIFRLVVALGGLLGVVAVNEFRLQENSEGPPRRLVVRPHAVYDDRPEYGKEPTHWIADVSRARSLNDGPTIDARRNQR